MKYITEFRNPDASRSLIQKIEEAAKRLEHPIKLMEVCGSHSMAIARHGLREILPKNVELISGPGCPVCVTQSGYIDAAAKIAAEKHIICTFGDMIRVPGSETSLQNLRAGGSKIFTCYSPLETLDIAEANRTLEIVFLAVGFETTTGPILGMLEEAKSRNIKNVSILTSLKTILPALTALSRSSDIKISGFILPAHVSAVIGSKPYIPFVTNSKIPAVISGFEPLDILLAVLELVNQISEGKAELINQYSRVVTENGNMKIKDLMNEFLEDYDAEWRGLGSIPSSGLRLKDKYRKFDASKKLGIEIEKGKENPNCKCGEVLRGILTPNQCPNFSKKCTPENPLGACMVSSEGNCAAAFKYGGYR